MSDQHFDASLRLLRSRSQVYGRLLDLGIGLLLPVGHEQKQYLLLDGWLGDRAEAKHDCPRSTRALGFTR